MSDDEFNTILRWLDMRIEFLIGENLGRMRPDTHVAERLEDEVRAIFTRKPK